MANVLSTFAREAFLGGDLDWDADDFKIVILDNTYTYSSAHNALDDVTGGARIATSSNLASKTKTNGTADSADVTFLALPGGDTITQIWLFHDTGVESTSTLVAYYDTNAAAAAISVATNGQDLTVAPNASGWFTL